MSAKLLSHNYTGKSLVVIYSDATGVHTKFVETSHPHWLAVLALYKEGRYDEMFPMLDLSKAIETQSGGVFTVADGKIFYKGKPAEGNYLFERIAFYMRELPKQYPRLLAFAENLYQNSDPAVIQSLYKFLEHGGNTITDDGCFLAYKGVDKDGWSKTSGKIKVLVGKTKLDPNTAKNAPADQKYFIYNGVGEVIKVERAGVCADPNKGCEQGIHLGSFDYANSFKGTDGVMMICKVNPRNVCSVPKDESFKKVRACEYEVIAQEGRKLDEKRDSNFHKVAKLRYERWTNDKTGQVCKRGADGKFCS